MTDIEKAEKQLINVVDQLKLTRAERDELYKCIKILKDGTSNVHDSRQQD